VQPARGTCLQFGPSDGVVGADTSFPKVRLFRFPGGQELRTLARPGAAHQVGYDPRFGVLSPDGRLLAVAAEREGVVLVDVRRMEEVALLPLPSNWPLHFDPSGKALLTYGRDGLLRWPLRAAEAAREGRRVGPPALVAPTTTEDSWGSSSDGTVIAIPAYDRGALLLRPRERALLLGPQNDVRTCAVSPDGRWVATGSHGLREGAGARVWDAREGKPVAELPVGAHSGALFSPDGKWLVTHGSGYRIWAVGTWEEGPALGGEGSNGGSPFTADGKLLALGDAPGVVRLVLPDSGREVARLTAPEPTRLMPKCFTPDGAELCFTRPGMRHHRTPGS
jgi:WD40 repeat protein